MSEQLWLSLAEHVIKLKESLTWQQLTFVFLPPPWFSIWNIYDPPPLHLTLRLWTMIATFMILKFFMLQVTNFVLAFVNEAQIEMSYREVYFPLYVY